MSAAAGVPKLRYFDLSGFGGLAGRGGVVRFFMLANDIRQGVAMGMPVAADTDKHQKFICSCHHGVQQYSSAWLQVKLIIDAAHCDAKEGMLISRDVSLCSRQTIAPQPWHSFPSTLCGLRLTAGASLVQC